MTEPTQEEVDAFAKAWCCPDCDCIPAAVYCAKVVDRERIRAALLAAAQSRPVADQTMRTALEQIILMDQLEKQTLVEFDPAGSTYEVILMDGPCAKIARAALNHGPANEKNPPLGL